MLSLVQIYFNTIGYQYLLLFPLAAIEGPIISVIAGFLIAQSLMNPYLAILVIIFGDLAGDILFYILGRRGTSIILKLFKLSPEKLKQMEYYFIEHGGKTLLFGKLAHGIGASFIFAAGSAKMPFRKFIYYTTLGTIPKSFVLVLIGYLFGQSFVRIEKYFDYFALFTLTLGVILAIAYLVFAKKLRKKEGI